MNLSERRLPTLLGLVLLGVVVGGIYWLTQKGQVPTEVGAVPQKVRITNVADNKFSVSWITPTPTAGQVEYGKVGEKLTGRKLDDRDQGTPGRYLTHHVTLEELQPNTQYAFRILVGERPTRFDNNGTPYTAATGPVIAATPPAKSFYGTVKSGKIPADGAVVYISLPGAAPVSTLVKSSGSYTISISTVRTSDLKHYVTYDPAATVVTVSVEGGAERSDVSVSTANMAPVPAITLGLNADFRVVGEPPEVAQVEPTQSASPSAAPATPEIFNVEPLGEENEINAVTNSGLTILNPAVEGETLATLRPEFRGTGPKATTLTIALTGQKAISDTTVVDADGTWSWAPVIDLKAGKQTITVSYIAEGGTTQKLARGFTAATAITSDPAFVSSPSASIKVSPTPRAGIPATDSGVPVTGVLTPTLLTGIMGIVIMILGAALFAL